MLSLSLSFLMLSAVAVAASASEFPKFCTGNVIATPTFGANGIFSACANITIYAPMTLIYNTIIDFRKYQEWDTFTYNATVPVNVTTAQDVYAGMPMTLYTTGLLTGVNTTSNEIISNLAPLDRPPYVSWKYDSGFVSDLGIVNGEHVSVLYDLGDGNVRYVSWETYYGAGSVVIDAALGANLQKQFVQQGIDLKKRCEV